MARTAVLTRTHQGGKADPSIGPKEQLLRIASSTMLFEDTFHEKGDKIAQNLADLVAKNTPEDVAEVARIAKNDLKLRHVPLWLAVQLAIKTKGQPGARKVAGDLIRDMIKRPDELAEIIALYFKAVGDDRSKKGKTNLPASMKRGIAAAFPKFNEYSLAKWNRDNPVMLRDALFLSHPKPQNSVQDLLWKRLMKDVKTNSPALDTPDTWEVELSAGKDKRETWERLIRERKLGAMALLMNLRNMTEAGVDSTTVREALSQIDKGSKLLPFRFVAAAQFAPNYADELSEAMLRAVEGISKLGGTTVLVVDNSGSMHGAPISAKSKMDRTAASGALAVLIRQVSDEVRVFGYGTEAKEIKNIKGLPLIDALRNGPGGGTNTAAALRYAKTKVPDPTRVILITDEQASDGIIENWGQKQGYLVNVAPNTPGLLAAENGWQRINGWSERLVEWIAIEEGKKVDAAEE